MKKYRWFLVLLPLLFLAQVPIDITLDNIRWKSNTQWYGYLDHNNQNSDKIWSFPDVSGNVVIDNAPQDLSNKTFTSSTSIESGVELTNVLITGGTISGLSTFLSPSQGGTGKGSLTNFILPDYIKDGAIGSSAIADGSITSSKLANNAILASNITDDSIGGYILADNSITSSKLVDNSVISSKIADNAITGAKLADNSVTEAKLQDSSIATNKLAASAVTSVKILNGTILLEDLSAEVQSGLSSSAGSVAIAATVGTTAGKRSAFLLDTGTFNRLTACQARHVAAATRYFKLEFPYTTSPSDIIYSSTWTGGSGFLYCKDITITSVTIAAKTLIFMSETNSSGVLTSGSLMVTYRLWSQ